MGGASGLRRYGTCGLNAANSAAVAGQMDAENHGGNVAVPAERDGLRDFMSGDTFADALPVAAQGMKRKRGAEICGQVEREGGRVAATLGVWLAQASPFAGR